MIKLFLKFKKPIFGPFLAHSPNFWGKKFLKNTWLCHAQYD